MAKSKKKVVKKVEKTAVKKDRRSGEFVTKEHLDEQLMKIVELVEKVVEPKVEITGTPMDVKPPVSNESVAKSQVDRTPVPAEWNLYIDSHLGKDIGRSVSYSKAGIILRMSVPKHLSNAPNDHWNYYHHDLRTTAIDPREGFEGVKRYVDLVARNLKFDLRTVTERNNKLAIKNE